MIIKIKVYPSSGREEVVKIFENEYKVYLKKHAEDGKANLELLKFLKKYFGANVKILKGLRSRDKIVEVENN